MSRDNHDTLDPMEALVAQARRQFPLLYLHEHYPSLDFDSPTWNFRPVTAPKGTKASILFFLPLNGDPPYPREFSDLLKAFVILNRLNGPNARNYVDAFRHFWTALSQRVRESSFHWSAITSDHLDLAEQLMIDQGWQSTTVYSRSCKLLTLSRWLDSNEICEGLEWTPRTKDPKIERTRTKAGREKRLDRLPTRRAIEGLGEIYRVHAKTPKDRLLICAIGLLLVAGFRISELLTLPADCWVKEFHRGRMRYGLRFWNRKSRGGVWQWAVRWLSPMGAELARSLLDEIEDITRSARAQAAVLERDPTRVIIPGTEGREELTTREVQAVFGLSRNGVAKCLFTGTLKLSQRRLTVGKSRPNLFPKSEVEAELLRRRAPLFTMDLGNGEMQALSETLLIVHPGVLENRARALAPLLVVHLRYHHFQTFLKDSKNNPYNQSVFKRFGITEPSQDAGRDRFSTMRSSMFRHWLNTLANKAGMSAFQITMWMQRTNASHTLLYLHSASDIADLTREGIRDGQLVGGRVDEFNALPQESREDYLETISAAHQTSTGKCTADFSVNGCGMSKACELGCPFYLHTVGDDWERSNLVAKKERCLLALRRIEAAEHEGRIVQPRQRELYESWIVEIDRLLATSKNS